MKHLKIFEEHDDDDLNNRIFLSLLRNDKLDKALEYLKNNPDVDPGQNVNLAIKTAVGEDNYEFVEYLLKDERVNPAADHNSAISIAARQGHIELVKLLLTDERVNPVDEYYFLSAFEEACKYDNIEIVKLLMQDERVKQYISNKPYSEVNGVVKGLLMDELGIDSEEELKIVFMMM